MNVLNFNTGEIALAVNGDEGRVFRFNPADPKLRERFYNAYRELRDGEKVKALTKKAEAADQSRGAGEDGIPADVEQLLEVDRELERFLRELMDGVFGAGTCEVVFGETSLAAVTSDGLVVGNFLAALMPYFEKEVSAAVQKHTEKYRGGA